jgi:hypothetical protein
MLKDLSSRPSANHAIPADTLFLDASDRPECKEVPAENEQDRGLSEGKLNPSKRRWDGPDGIKKRGKRGGKAIRQANGDETEARQIRLGQKHLAVATVHSSTNFSLTANSRVSSTGWQGQKPSIEGKEAVLKAYNDGGIKGYISLFYPVPFDE